MTHMLYSNDIIMVTNNRSATKQKLYAVLNAGQYQEMRIIAVAVPGALAAVYRFVNSIKIYYKIIDMPSCCHLIKNALFNTISFV